MTWHPHGLVRPGARGGPPDVGDVVALNWRAWEVMHVREADLTPEEEERLNGYHPTHRAQLRPFHVTLRRLYGPVHENENDRNEVGFRVRAGALCPLPRYDHGLVPLCSCHGHPWPCLEAEQQRWAEKELARTEKLLKLLPGCCPACEEPVTHRQRSITFGGPNVQNPLAEGPTYHLRRSCWSAAARYEELWVAAEPGRLRSLLTLSCDGHLIVHGDGAAECFGASADCPSVYAQHRHLMACYWQSHGCGRECPREGHPGTRIAGRPAHPRDITGGA